MNIALLWFILISSNACLSVVVGVHTKSDRPGNKKEVGTIPNKPWETNNPNVLGNNLSLSFNIHHNKTTETKALYHLNYTAVVNKNKTEDGVNRTKSQGSQNQIGLNSSTIATTQIQGSRPAKLLEGHTVSSMVSRTVDRENVLQRNDSEKAETKSSIAKSSKEVHQKPNARTEKKKAKKLLVSFFDSESDDSELAKSFKESRVNNTQRVQLNTTKSPTSNDESQTIYKRTRLLTQTVQPQTSGLKLNNHIIETALPSGSNVNSPQHVRVSNQPTHVMFKPVHKYFPAIHRYMTRPIHRFLKKPVNLGSLAPQLAGPQPATQVQLPGQNIQNRPVIGQQVDVPQVHPGIISQNVVPGGLPRVNPPIQAAIRHVTPVRVYTPITPRIQPVLIHPHRLSTTGYGPCSTNPCKNSGVCSSVNGDAVCICRPGFRGKLCELINSCQPNPCHNFGSCTEKERDFECTCKKGYRGKQCEVEDKCEPNPCMNGGTCSESEDDYVCSCREGFLGHSCEVESKCDPINPCKNGATCQEARDTYKCFCREGFGGYNCEARVTHDHCIPNPCHHGGYCTVTGTSIGNYTCSCQPGWKGITCTDKVDNWGNSVSPSICESVNPCMFGGKCTPVGYYDYTCACPPGRGGVHCEQNLLQFKLPKSCSGCHTFARCLNDHCVCNQDYEGDGKHCVPARKYCHPNPCYNGGTCQEASKRGNISSTDKKQWWCECPEGYKGENCQEMDLCHMNLCQNGGSCTSSKGEARCVCPTPYTGKYCEEKDACHVSPCENGGSCKVVQGVAKCICPEDYEGIICDHWKCSQCDPNATCNKGTCVCKINYSGDGKTCRKKIPKVTTLAVPLPAPATAVQQPKPINKFCYSNPCANGATCLEALDTYFCQCPEDKYGKQCDQTPKVIAELCSKCDIEATCKDGKCTCNEGFTGNGFKCKKTEKHSEEQETPNFHKIDSSCEFCPENGQCLNNVCVCPPGFENRKRSCVAIDVPVTTNSAHLKTMPPGIEYVGTTRNRLPIGQWKEKSVVSEHQSLGCWADTTDWRNPIMRAMETMEGLHPLLNDDYKKRLDPITKCANAAQAYGYKIFAVQNGGQCFSGRDAAKTYTTYGPSTLCRFGVGGVLSNDVYRLS